MSSIFSQVNFMSQRADILASNKLLADYEVAAGKRQYTLGAEGISERMRSYFNKNLTKEMLVSAMTMLMKYKSVKEIKLFYIIAGLETEEDIADFKNFLGKIKEIKAQTGSQARILCSFGLLVRMPYTPLMYERLIMTKEEWEPVVKNIQNAVTAAGYEFRLTYPYEEYFFSQYLALTNQSMAENLIALNDKNFLYDDGVYPAIWSEFTKLAPVTEEFTAEKDDSYNFAFDFIETYTSKKILYKRFQNAKAGIETATCMSSNCKGCLNDIYRFR